MKKSKLCLTTASVIIVFLLMAIASTPPRQTYKPPPPQPCVTHGALTFSPILVQINLDANYTMKDLATVKDNLPTLFLDALRARNYSYQLADGVTPNLIFYITITNDNYDHYGASVTVNGLGTGYLFNYNLPQQYVTISKLVDDMASKANEFVTEGWHTGNCNY